MSKNCQDVGIDERDLQLIGQWDFQGPPIMGPPYGKLPILIP